MLLQDLTIFAPLGPAWRSFGLALDYADLSLLDLGLLAGTSFDVSVLISVSLLGLLLVCAYWRLRRLDTFLVKLGLGVVDLVDACFELVSLCGETLLTDRKSVV